MVLIAIASGIDLVPPGDSQGRAGRPTVTSDETMAVDRHLD